MKIIENSFIPFKGYVAITIWPFIFVRYNYWKRYTDQQKEVVVNHENIHGKQQKELLVIPFYVIYILEYLVRCVITGNASKAYRAISFEKEAFANEKDFNYIKNRKPFAMFRRKG